jgi:phage FluMu protein gp41
MREIADDGGGALLVDPYDDESIGAAMRTLLTNDAVLAELAAEAVLRVPRTWDAYASDLWTYFVDHEVVAGRAVSRSDATA